MCNAASFATLTRFHCLLHTIGNISVGDLVRGICHSSVIRNRLHSASEKKKSIQSPLPSIYTDEVG